MANETIGKITCPHCNEAADVRRYKSGARLFYYVCGCGIIRPNTRQGQAWIMDNARLYGPDGAPETHYAVPEQDATPAPPPLNPADTPEQTPEKNAAHRAPPPPPQRAAKGGFFDGLDI